MASEQAKQLAVSLAALRNETNTPGQIAEFASLIDDAYECTCTERDELKAALRELMEATKEHRISLRSDLTCVAEALQAGRFSDMKSYNGKESHRTQPRRDAAVAKAESLLNPIDYAAEKRADKAREMKEAMREANKEADDGQS